MNKKKGFLFSIALLLLVGTVFSWYSAHKVDARELALFQILVQAVDADTNEPIGVSVKSPSTALSKFNERNPIYHVEISPPGLIRASWVDFENSDSTVTLSADGYSPIVVPQILIERRRNISALGGSRKPDILKLNKTQPVDTDNPDNPPLNSKNQLDD
jgi:hypothetical protein